MATLRVPRKFAARLIEGDFLEISVELDWHSNLVFVCFVLDTSPKKSKMSHEKGPFLKRNFFLNHLPSIHFQALVSDKNPRMTTRCIQDQLVGNWRDIFFTLKSGGVFWGTHLETTMACWKITHF